MPVLQCARCGRPNPDDARYCSHCGTPLLAGLAGPGGRQTGPPGPGGRQASPPRPGETTSTISLNRDDPDYGDDLYPDPDLSALPAGTALLRVKRGPNAGAIFRLDNDLTTAGRHPDSDIFLDDVTVSRRHVEFYRENGRFTVRDVGSLNGTYVNGSRIEEAELVGGDEVQIGKFRLQFVTSPELWGQTIPGERHGRGSQGYA